VISLYTAGTPNGWKASVALEELELPYRVEALSLGAKDQRKPEYLKLNPEYSIADIANWCWVRTYSWSGVSIDGLDALSAWIDPIDGRPAARRGVAVPKAVDLRASGEEIVGAARKMLV